MLCIMKVLLTNPKLLIMDEPSEGLDPLIIQTIDDIILRLKKEGLSSFLVEQNVSLALKVSDYAYVLHKGETIYQSSTSKLGENQKVQREHIGVSKSGKKNRQDQH